MLEAYERYQQAWVERRWDDLVEALHDGYTFSLDGRTVGGVEAMVTWSRGLLAAIPDYAHDIVATHPAPPVLLVEAVAVGTTSGLPLADGLPVPRRGGAFRLPYVKVLEFSNGRIRDDRQFHDAETLLAQFLPRVDGHSV